MGSTRIDTSVGGTSLLDHFDIQPATQANPFPFFQAAAECLQPTSLCITSQRKLVIDLKYEAAFLHLKLAVSSLVSTFAIVFFGAIASRLLTPLKVEFHWKVLSGGAFLLGAFLILRLPVDHFRNQLAVCNKKLLYHRERIQSWETTRKKYEHFNQHPAEVTEKLTALRVTNNVPDNRLLPPVIAMFEFREEVEKELEKAHQIGTTTINQLAQKLGTSSDKLLVAGLNSPQRKLQQEIQQLILHDVHALSIMMTFKAERAFFLAMINRPSFNGTFKRLVESKIEALRKQEGDLKFWLGKAQEQEIFTFHTPGITPLTRGELIGEKALTVQEIASRFLQAM